MCVRYRVQDSWAWQADGSWVLVVGGEQPGTGLYKRWVAGGV